MAEDDICMPCEEPVIDKYPPCPLQCRSPKCTAYMKHFIDSKEQPIVWVTGGPGSGKTTQCAKYMSKVGCTHLCIGDLLREEIKSGSDRAKCLETIMQRGELVPTDVVLTILKAAMLKKKADTMGYLIDGYPREKHQGAMFEKNIAPCTVIVFLDVSPETMKKRLQSRPPQPGRPKEDENYINARINIFEQHKKELLDQYPDILHKISAEVGVDEIQNQIAKILDPIMTEAIKNAVANIAAKKEEENKDKEKDK